jgi:hypothetical protein
MVTGDRILELPTAAVYLSEACWRTGAETGADSAADLALDAARRQRSDHLLLQPLAARRLDGEPGADSVWHRLGRSIRHDISEPRSAVTLTMLRLHDLGRPWLVSDGAPVRARLTKALEVLAHLMVKPSHEAHVTSS